MAQDETGAVESNDLRRHQRLCELFSIAPSIPTEEREEWIREQCGTDTHLRSQLQQMLATGLPSGLVGTGAVLGRSLEELPTPSGLPASIGGYKVVGLIGEGGMGVVYEALQESPRRRVAIKVVRSLDLSPRALWKFLDEAEMLGKLQHEGIAQVIEAGTDPRTGLPFLAMERVEGQPLLQHVEKAHLGIRERLDLFVRICRAVQHVHAKGLVHRDLKPANVLVTADQIPKVLDFGIARSLGEENELRARASSTGLPIGTLPYMSPEQAAGDLAAIDIRSDIYALGVMLFELLAGQRPLLPEKLPLHEAVHEICEAEPTRLGSLDNRFTGDLEAIAAKALAKDPNSRYGTASELAADIERHLANEPIAAHPPTTRYLLTRFARRHRKIVVGASSTLVVLLIGVLTTSWQWRVAKANLALVEIEATRAERNAQEASASAARAEEQAKRARLAERESKAEAARATRLLALFRDGFGEGLIEEFGRDALLVDGMRRLYQRVEERFEGRPRELGELHYTFATMLEGMGFPAEAARHASRSVELRPDGESRLESLARLAGILIDTGDIERAIENGSIAYEGSLELHGVEDARTWLRAQTFALALQQSGDLSTAGELFEETLVRLTRILGPLDPATLEATNSLSVLLQEAGETERARDLLSDTCEALEASLGLEDPSTLNAMNSLATVLHDMGESVEALAYLRLVYEGRTSRLGVMHPKTISSLANYSAVLSHVGELEEAETLVRRALAASLEVLPNDSLAVLKTRGNLAALLFRMERFEEALVEQEEVVRLASTRLRGGAVLGVWHNDLGYLRLKNGDMTGAEEALARAVPLLGRDHPQVIGVVGELIARLDEVGDMERAAAWRRVLMDSSATPPAPR